MKKYADCCHLFPVFLPLFKITKCMTAKCMKPKLTDITM